MGMSTDGGEHSSFSGAKPMMAEINITPLVDVMLVLLIIFMVTTPLLQQGVEVNLPKASAPGLKSTAETTLIISVRKDGAIFMAKELVDEKKLAESLQAIIANNPDKQVLMRADKDVSYGMVVKTMALVRKSGVAKLGMITQQEEPAQ